MSASRAAGQQRATSGSSAYVWEVPGRNLAVQIDLRVLERIGGEAYSAFKLLPKRGAEIGGILLGHVDLRSGRVVVQDYEPVPCRYCSGPSYTLSGDDEAAFAEAVRRWAPQPKMRTAVVGFYRSHTRPGMVLDDADAALLDSHLPDPNIAVLLVKPSGAGHATGGFLFRVDGELEREYRYPEFPFGAAAAPGAPEVYAESPLTTLNRSLADGHAPNAADPSGQSMLEAARGLPWASAPRPSSFRWHQALAPIAVLVALVAFFLYLRERWPQGGDATTPARIIAPETSPLGLKIAREQPYLRLNWNQAADVVLNAVHGKLTVSDGVSRRDLEMDVAQLRSGSIAYAPTSDDVTFRLEIFLSAGRTVSESIRIIGALPSSPARVGFPALGIRPASPAEPVSAAPAQPLPPPAKQVAVEQRPAPRVEPRAEALPPEPPAAAPPSSEPAEQEPDRTQAATPQSATQAAAPPPASQADKPEASVEEPKPAPAKPEAVMASVPTALQAPPPAPLDSPSAAVEYVPPKPVRSIRPTMSPTVRRLLESEVQVDINVSIDRTGKVTDARPTAAYKGITGYLAGQAANAARMWRFTPALRNGEPVPGEYLLRFQFRKTGE